MLEKPPKKIIAGDNYSFYHGFADYIADGYTVVYKIRGLAELTKSSTSDVIILTTAETANLQAGISEFVITAEKTGQRVTLAVSQIEVLPDPSSTGPAASKATFLQRTLNAVEAYIEKRASNDQIDHLKAVIRNNDNEQSLERMSFPQLLELRDSLRLKVRNEQGTVPRFIRFKFSA